MSEHRPRVTPDDPAKVKVRDRDGVEFDVQGGDGPGEEILYLKFEDEEKLENLRDFAEFHLEANA